MTVAVGIGQVVEIPDRERAAGLLLPTAARIDPLLELQVPEAGLARESIGDPPVDPRLSALVILGDADALDGQELICVISRHPSCRHSVAAVRVLDRRGDSVLVLDAVRVDFLVFFELQPGDGVASVAVAPLHECEPIVAEQRAASGRLRERIGLRIIRMNGDGNEE